MSATHSDTVQQFLDDYDKYIRWIATQANREQITIKNIENNLNDVFNDPANSPTETKIRLKEKKRDKRILDTERKKAEDIKQKLDLLFEPVIGRRTKDFGPDIKAAAENIGGLELYKAGEWKD